MRALLLALALALPTSPAYAVPLDYLPALAGDYFRLSSPEVGTYHIYVRLPEGYAAHPGRHYPVVYLLDGDSAFPMLAPQQLFMTYDDKTPEVIMVGIAYGSFDPSVNRRDRDFGPNARAFQDWLARDLIPTVERRFRTQPTRRILVGQSFGGAYVLYDAFTRPNLFWGRIASNPSFRFHKEILGGPPPAQVSGGTLVVVSGTAENPVSRAAHLDWFRRIEGKRTPWTLRRIDLHGGTHAADFGNAYRQAMRLLFGRPGSATSAEAGPAQPR